MKTLYSAMLATLVVIEIAGCGIFGDKESELFKLEREIENLTWAKSCQSGVDCELLTIKKCDQVDFRVYSKYGTDTALLQQKLRRFNEVEVEWEQELIHPGFWIVAEACRRPAPTAPAIACESNQCVPLVEKVEPPK